MSRVRLDVILGLGMRSLAVGVAQVALVAACASDGGPVALRVSFQNVSAPGALVASDSTTHDVAFARGVYAIAPAGTFPLFRPGGTATPGIEALAEDGVNTTLLGEARPVATSAATFAAVDTTTYAESPIAPGISVEVDIDAAPGDALSLASMFAQSNDVFVGPVDGELPLFVGAEPVLGDVTAMFSLFDAGTEANEEPGLGPAQAPRQPSPNYGTDDRVPIAAIAGTDAAGLTYPSLESVLSITITRVE